jgi:transcriptional regulator with XRE-family HTH domain
MNLSLWLTQEIERRGWTPADLARRASLDQAAVEAILNKQSPPDFDFCYRTAQALEKQPERVLHLAGLLSETGLKLALSLTSNQTLPSPKIRAMADQLSAEERRLILACISRQDRSSSFYTELRLSPGEFNKEERTQDRIRFAILVVILVLLLIGLSLGIGIIVS